MKKFGRVFLILCIILVGVVNHAYAGKIKVAKEGKSDQETKKWEKVLRDNGVIPKWIEVLNCRVVASAKSGSFEEKRLIVTARPKEKLYMPHDDVDHKDINAIVFRPYDGGGKAFPFGVIIVENEGHYEVSKIMSSDFGFSIDDFEFFNMVPKAEISTPGRDAVFADTSEFPKFMSRLSQDLISKIQDAANSQKKFDCRGNLGNSFGTYVCSSFQFTDYDAYSAEFVH